MVSVSRIVEGPNSFSVLQEVLRTITTHALTTENEEVMGLLLGDTFVSNLNESFLLRF